MSRVAFFLLGPPRIKRDGKLVKLDERKALALAVYLAVTGRSHGGDALATLFWPGLDQNRARAGLRRALAALKQELGESCVVVDGGTIGINSAAEVWVDVRAFRERVAAYRMHDHPQSLVCPACIQMLKEAVTLYGDDFLAGFTLTDSPEFDDWRSFQSQGLRDDLATVLEGLVQAYSIEGSVEPAINCAQRWLALDSLNEVAHRQLMQLYAWAGQRAAALRQYEECKRILNEELGVAPAEETEQVYQAILVNQELPLPVHRSATPGSPPIAQQDDIPVQPTPMSEREGALLATGAVITALVLVLIGLSVIYLTRIQGVASQPTPTLVPPPSATPPSSPSPSPSLWPTPTPSRPASPTLSPSPSPTTSADVGSPDLVSGPVSLTLLLRDTENVPGGAYVVDSPQPAVPITYLEGSYLWGEVATQIGNTVFKVDRDAADPAGTTQQLPPYLQLNIEYSGALLAAMQNVAADPPGFNASTGEFWVGRFRCGSAVPATSSPYRISVRLVEDGQEIARQQYVVGVLTNPVCEEQDTPGLQPPDRR